MTRQIIVADDHPLFREALKAAVGRLDTGTSFIEADSVATLLAALESHADADLLLLDLNMPGAHGFNALAHVRGSRPGLPVVVVSADDDAKTIAGALRYGAQGFIPRPVRSARPSSPC
jgi:DNA-binding NarL/FixJ family response regulator